MQEQVSRMHESGSRPKALPADVTRSGLRLVCVGGVRLDGHEDVRRQARTIYRIDRETVRFALAGASAIAAVTLLGRSLLHALHIF